jgi:hypothetical protein
MKKLISMIGIASAICLFPCCKKSDSQPDVPSTQSSQVQKQIDTAKLYVLLDSKACATLQSQYTSASVDIRNIAVLNSEVGWEELTTVPGAWDVVSLQSAPVPVADLTEKSTVHAGSISKIRITFGDNNKLVVNDQPVDCYSLSRKEIILDLEANIEARSLNQIVVSIDICGNIKVTPRYNDTPCYTLDPVMAFESFSQVGIGDTQTPNNPQ